MGSSASATAEERQRHKTLFSEARSARDALDVGRAVAIAEVLVSSEPLNFKYRNFLALMLCQIGSDRAFSIAEPLSDTRWERFALRARLLRLALERRDDDQIHHQLSRLTPLSPHSEGDYRELIALLFQHQRTADAELLDERRRTFVARPTAVSTIESVTQRFPSVITRYAVNIGCHDGKGWGDPCYELFNRGWSGIAIDAGNHPAIHTNLPQPNVAKLLNTFVTPRNIAGILRENGCPHEFDLLKIDIDSFDGIILRAILGDYRPHVIHMEVNPEIPPPIAFSIQYDARYGHSGRNGFFGCSVSYVLRVCRPLGYEIVDLDLSSPPTRQDILLAKRELGLSAAQVDERELFLAQPAIRGSFMEIDIDTRAWRTIMATEELFSAVWDACCSASMGTLRPRVAVPPVGLLRPPRATSVGPRNTNVAPTAGMKPSCQLGCSDA